MQTFRLLCLAGSTRTDSYNYALAGTMAKQLSLTGINATLISLEDYPLPLFNADDETEKGLPDNAVRLSKLLAQHDGVFIASPEYNASLTPLLKNTLDWISRVPSDGRDPFNTPVFAIGSASPGKLGGMRSLAHLRQILVALGAIVIPEQISIGSAGNAFDDKGDLTGDREAAFLNNCASKLVQTAQRLKSLA
ncbi:NADPH-dependent FMN reductase [Cohaesibacter celericrescens]|uniref:NADPH-dependent FMN reductase n=1 Tax=Cohaesibacter celericrescens TaxID=2067669 RepID=A0A2N5XP74_9HYPH|nr:NAD(P)H-dependent oxidoreductase [Cohaesibacter celericrescens]PLW76227.1 NADPH-dependent FMN reductase [Cohaesibacter celericrescens]